MLQVSSRPIEFYLPQGLDGTRSTTLRLRSVDKHEVPPRTCRAGAATYGVKQSAQSTSVHTVTPCSQRLGYKRVGPSGLAELQQLYMELDSEFNRHVYLSCQIHTS